jgi:hypothetical protein
MLLGVAEYPGQIGDNRSEQVKGDTGERSEPAVAKPRIPRGVAWRSSIARVTTGGRGSARHLGQERWSAT